jgi:vanillate O-demethylase ferredoxin subunit
MSEQTFPMRIAAIRPEAEGVISLLLEQPDGTPLPPVDPGAHVDLHLANGLNRSYSLSNGPADAGRYRLTIARDANSSGGSAFIHDVLKAGDTVAVSAPRNNFALALDAPASLFIAGGIGITPFVPMVAALNAAGRPWTLHYCVRTRGRAALLGELEALAAAGPGRLITNFDEEPGGTMLDLAGVLKAAAPGTHVYCCGPTGMLDAFRAAASAAGIDSDHVHFEYFSADVDKATEGGFTVVCQKSGVSLVVKPGETILQTLEAAGIDAPFSCEEGVCGSCETRVISGIPDHRDMILTPKERAENRTMMICCSGAKTPTLVLDI